MNPLVLLRALVVLLGLRLLGRFARGLAQGLGGSPTTAPPASSPEMVRDLICNTFLPRDRALHAIVHGQEAHFCSAACRDRALAQA